MSKTHFDDIDLSEAGIEADEVNSETATLGQVLTADGAGGAAFQDGVREGGWTAISFAPGWGNWDTPTNQFAYKRFGALIFLHGVVVRNSGTTQLIGVLPSGHRPAADPEKLVVATDTGYGRVEVDNAGQIKLKAGGAGWVSLDGIVLSV